MDDVKKVPKTASIAIAKARLLSDPRPPSMLITAFWALVLLFVPSAIVGFGFSLYAKSQAITDVSIWFSQIETMMAMTFSIYFIVLPSLLLLAKYAGDGSKINDYLQLSFHPLLLWLKVILLSIVFWGLFTLLGFILDLPEEPFMQQLKNSSMPIWFICLNVCLLAPIVEELTFRGFLFKRLMLTRLNVLGAAAITSATFAIIHSQYSILGVVMVFFLGLYFAWIRVKYNSTSLAIVAHIVCNMLSMTALYLFI